MDRRKRILDLNRRSIPIEKASENIGIALPPSDFVKRELEEREWTQANLARIIDRSETFIHNLISNKIRITTEIAALLGKAFDQDPGIWMGLEMEYQKDLAKARRMDDWAKAIALRISDEWSGGAEYPYSKGLLRVVLTEAFRRSPDLCVRIIGTGIIEDDYFENA